MKRNINKLVNKVAYAYPTLKEFNVFFNVKKAVAEKIIELNGDTNTLEQKEVIRVASVLHKELAGKLISKTDGTRSEAAVFLESPELERIVQNIEIEATELETIVRFKAALYGTYRVLHKGNRVGNVEMHNVGIGEGNVFPLKGKLDAYANDGASLAITNDTLWVAIEEKDSGEGVMNKKDLFITVIINNHMVRDRLSKYDDENLI